MKTDVENPVYTHFKAKGVCDSTILEVCSFSNLTYNQWLNGAVLKNPLPSQNVTDLSYTRNYFNYSALPVPPEMFYYGSQSGLEMPSATIEDVYQSFNSSGLFNGKIFQDVFLDFKNEGWNNIWNTKNFIEYVRYVTLNLGLEGLFVYKSPRELIEGYTDNLLSNLAKTPVYKGGD